jgi:hypothetical protein
MHYPDLSNECQVDSGPTVRAVGWLANGHAFTSGAVSDAFVEKLRRDLRSSWQPCVACGVHFCDFCPSHRFGGSRNVWFPSDSVKYVAPELILHYIEFHSYRPPDEFVEAVTKCPEQGSDEFLGLLSRFENWWDGQPQGGLDGSRRSSLNARPHRE